MGVTVHLSGEKENKKQVEFFNAVMRVVARFQKLGKYKNEIAQLPVKSKEYKERKRQIEELEEQITNDCLYFFYGGAIRGGKTFISLAILVILCKMFPRSKWGVIRKSMPRLKETTIPSLEKIIGNNPDVYWKRQASDYFCQFKNGSRIYFIAEDYKQDKQFNKFKGMEMNGFLLEQMEELMEDGFNIILSRAGSHYGVVGPMPPPIVLGTFNPTFAWVKAKIYDKWKKGELKSPYYFLPALPDDNPWVTAAQWRVWETLDEKTKASMIRGEWDVEVEDAFIYSFTDERNTSPTLSLKENYPLYISFDFNVDPMTCVIAQTDHETFFQVTHAFKIPNSDTYDLCSRLKPIIQGREHMVYVTGDASGKNRISGTRGHVNHYQIIQGELGLKDSQFKLLTSNPGLSDSRVFCNSVIQNFPSFLVHSDLGELIKDIKFTLTDTAPDGSLQIMKAGINKYLSIDNKEMGHLLDCLRYVMHITLSKWVKIPKS